jgi:serine/threonine protein kinase
MHNYEVSDALLNLITKMLNIDADERPSVEDILEDEWFQKTSQNMTHEENIAQ